MIKFATIALLAALASSSAAAQDWTTAGIPCAACDAWKREQSVDAGMLPRTCPPSVASTDGTPTRITVCKPGVEVIRVKPKR